MSKTYYDPADLRKFGEITEWSEELGKKFFDYYGKVFEEGALSAREKSLIALAVSHVVNCAAGVANFSNCPTSSAVTPSNLKRIHPKRGALAVLPLSLWHLRHKTV